MATTARTFDQELNAKKGLSVNERVRVGGLIVRLDSIEDILRRNPNAMLNRESRASFDAECRTLQIKIRTALAS